MNYFNRRYLVVRLWLGALSRKIRLTLQRVVLKLLYWSLHENTQIRYADFSPLLNRLTQYNPEEGVKIVRDRIQDSDIQVTPPEDIDKILNFSGNWRDDWVAKKAQSLPSGSRVLDAGAGQCQYKSLFAHTNYMAQDFAQYEGTQDGPLQETWTYPTLDYICDIVQIPVPDNTFDAVLCTEVLEHVPDPISAVRELCRVTQPGGKLFISAPLGSGLHQEPYHFFGGFSPYFYEKYLAEFGCEIIEIRPLGGLLRHVAQEVHRAARTIDHSSNVLSQEQRFVMMDWMPRLLSTRDESNFVEQFTVGYLVEARKKMI